MSFRVPDGRQGPVQKIIADYFNRLQRQGPAGMRSQCYTDQEDDSAIVHLNGFKKESIANHHFKSAIFREYIKQLESVSGKKMGFTRLHQHLTFESIY